MKIRVVFTGVFDPSTPTAMDQRMEHAFGADGKYFWERFFPCNKAHPNDRIIYLFTERQMRVLYNWLKKKVIEYGEKVKKNLEFSKQKFLLNAMPTPDGIYSNTIYACYIKRGFDNQLELSRVFFGAFPDKRKKNCINFFDGGFWENRPAVFTEEEPEILLTELLEMRPTIEKKFGDLWKNDEKWLCYIGRGINEKEHKSIEYYGDINACPFAENSIPPT